MAVPLLDRARIILDLIKDGDTVAGDAAYTGLDMATAALADKWLKPMYDNNQAVHLYDGTGTFRAWSTLTNDEKAEAFMKWLRLMLKQNRQQIDAVAAGITAQNSEIATINSEATTDLG